MKPWYFSGYTAIEDADGKDIAYVVKDGELDKQANINAQLIAAAPEMFECMKELDRLLSKAGYGAGATDLDDEAVTLAVLIRKAEGK